MREGWEEKRLGDISECKNGLIYSPSDVVKDEGTLVLRSSNIRGGRLAYEDNVYVSCSIPDRAIVRENDILICVRNGSRALIGKAAMIDAKAAGSAFGAFMAVLRSRMNDYVFQLLSTDQFFRQVHRSLGATINQITNADLKSFRFPFPPEPEQERITEILRTWDEALEKLNALRAAKERWRLGLARRLFARVRENPETTEIPLGHATRIVKGEQLSKLDIRPGPYPVWGGGVKPSGYHDAYNAEGGTITISGIGSPGFVNLENLPFWFNGNCYALKDISQGIERDFLFHNLKTREPEIMRLRAGSGQPYLPHTDLERFKVVIPPLPEQHRIASVLNVAREELPLIDAQITALTHQKRGLMQKLLTGEWRVNSEEVLT